MPKRAFLVASTGDRLEGICGQVTAGMRREMLGEHGAALRLDLGRPRDIEVERARGRARGRRYRRRPRRSRTRLVVVDELDLDLDLDDVVVDGPERRIGRSGFYRFRRP